MILSFPPLDLSPFSSSLSWMRKPPPHLPWPPSIPYHHHHHLFSMQVTVVEENILFPVPFFSSIPAFHLFLFFTWCWFVLLADGGIMFYFQLVIMAGTVLLAYYFEYTNTFPVHMQGFFCYDASFSKPYPGPESTSRIPPVLIYSLVIVIPTFTVRCVEVDASATLCLWWKVCSWIGKKCSGSRFAFCLK